MAKKTARYAAKNDAAAPALVIHGGAGAIDSAHFTQEQKQARHRALTEILGAGYAILSEGGSALDAAVHAVSLLEDCEFFNAGYGAVLAQNGTAELDASVMEGRAGQAGGVSTVWRIKNPVLAARAVMEKTKHTLLCGSGAEDFAQAQKLAMVDNDHFIVQERRESLKAVLDEAGNSGSGFDAEKSLGTVGAVAQDRQGHIAAATSTGGLTGKMPGRVSDSAIAGAGTWAEDGVCGVSCTGTGDIFIRNATAFDVAALMKYRGLSVSAACRMALDRVKEAGGAGGIIAIDGAGEIVMDFNTPEMYRGLITQAGQAQTYIAA